MNRLARLVAERKGTLCGRLFGALRAAALVPVRIVAPLLPSDTTTPEGQKEAVVLYGLALLAAAFAAAGMPPLALGVPGALLVAIGLGFSLRRLS